MEAKYKICKATMEGIDSNRGIIPFVLTADVIDRDGEVIVPTGGKFDNYKNNPVFLWAHDLSRAPIGKVLPESIMVTEQEVKALVQFDMQDSFANQIFNKYKNGFLNAGSIRFIPLKVDRPETQDQPGATISEWELLEFSAVPVPANQAALTLKAVEEEQCDGLKCTLKGFLEYTSENKLEPTPMSWIKSLENRKEEVDLKQITEISNKLIGEVKAGRVLSSANLKLLKSAIESLTSILQKIEQASEPKGTRFEIEKVKRLYDFFDGEEIEFSADEKKYFGELSAALETILEVSESKAVVPFEPTEKAPLARPWDGAAAVKRLRTFIGGGDIGKFDLNNATHRAAFRRAFVFVDGDGKTLAQYKLPHHDIINGKLSAVWRGVAAGMVALLGGRGGVNIPDAQRRGSYNHLVRHYEQFDKKPPEFKEFEEKNENALEHILEDSQQRTELVDKIAKLILKGD